MVLMHTQLAHFETISYRGVRVKLCAMSDRDDVRAHMWVWRTTHDGSWEFCGLLLVYLESCRNCGCDSAKHIHGNIVLVAHKQVSSLLLANNTWLYSI